ncbi:MAG: transporter substrate-binding domain-containing protein [Proteobacteria bacterium]|nr:transporter substrate-binding domain-containing protein [Pseudomonadota bacterium]
MGFRAALASLAVAAAAMIPGPADAGLGDTVKTIKERGHLLCTGHNGTYLGFAEVDSTGNWHGFDIELCKAMATAILGAPTKLKIVPVSFAQRFPALQSGDIDVIIKVTGWTLGRDTELGLQFSRPYFLGATQIAVNVSTGAKSAKDLNGASVCSAAGTSTERLAADYLTNLKVKFEVVSFEKVEEMRSAFFSGRCDAIALWGPNLAISIAQAADPSKYAALPDILAVEPQSIAMRQGDDHFVDVANWLLTALLVAEEYGITSENIDQHKAKPANPTVERLLGVTPGIGKRLGLSETWAYDVIKAVGSYKQIFDRTLGDGSPYKMKRAINGLIRDGGVMYPLIID